MSRRRTLALLAFLTLVAGGLAGLMAVNAPATTRIALTSCIQNGETCLRLPTASGQNLDGAELTFPADFAGRLNLVVMPFDRDQQVRAIAWVPLLQELARQDAGIAYYNIAALPDLSPAIRLLVQGGLSAAISDSAVREATVVYYLEDQAGFLTALGLADTDEMAVFIFDIQGRVLYRAVGDYDAERGAELQRIFIDLLD